MDSSEISISSVIKSAVTDTIETNASFQSSAGIRAKIKRVAHAGCCDTCAALEGEWYYDEAPDDVYWRHGNCTCTVTYDPGTGKAQNVHTKAWSRENESEKIERRKTVGLEASSSKGKIKISSTADARDKLTEIDVRNTDRIQQGFSCFDRNTILAEFARKIQPEGNYFDVALHGSAKAVAYFSDEVNMSPRTLAMLIKNDVNYKNQPVRLLSCNTGKQTGEEYCFAEELANILGVTVKAPNDTLYIRSDGTFYVGADKKGDMVEFKPNQRRRLK